MDILKTDNKWYSVLYHKYTVPTWKPCQRCLFIWTPKEPQERKRIYAAGIFCQSIDKLASCCTSGTTMTLWICQNKGAYKGCFLWVLWLNRTRPRLQNVNVQLRIHYTQESPNALMQEILIGEHMIKINNSLDLKNTVHSIRYSSTIQCLASSQVCLEYMCPDAMAH